MPVSESLGNSADDAEPWVWSDLGEGTRQTSAFIQQLRSLVSRKRDWFAQVQDMDHWAGARCGDGSMLSIRSMKRLKALECSSSVG